mmetsp:Transcript_12400/g.22974  ORF Transcript_12400/g.22974 Transcript_12400/m.22974 type:complete len:213 (-) Transcript_12400:157-795(-)
MCSQLSQKGPPVLTKAFLKTGHSSASLTASRTPTALTILPSVACAYAAIQNRTAFCWLTSVGAGDTVPSVVVMSSAGELLIGTVALIVLGGSETGPKVLPKNATNRSASTEPPARACSKSSKNWSTTKLAATVVKGATGSEVCKARPGSYAVVSVTLFCSSMSCRLSTSTTVVSTGCSLADGRNGHQFRRKVEDIASDFVSISFEVAAATSW